MKVLSMLGALGRKIRNGYRTITGADELEGPPHDPAEMPRGNAGGSIAGTGGNISL